jgi:hypothetical protein
MYTHTHTHTHTHIYIYIYIYIREHTDIKIITLLYNTVKKIIQNIIQCQITVVKLYIEYYSFK